MCLVSAGWGAGEVLPNDGKSWPTLRGEVTRSGFYPEFPAGPLEVVWRKELHEELTGPRAEVIVSEGVAMMGTYRGNLYGWDARSGEERWVVRTGGAIGHSPAVAEGVVYFAGMDGRLRAVRVEDGSGLWERELGAGCWVAPLVHAGRVHVGLRDGRVQTYSAADGELLWEGRTGARIAAPASMDGSGARVIVSSEDMHVYCFDAATGEEMWKSARLAGTSLRDYAPLVVGGLVMVGSSPVRDFHAVLDAHQELLLKQAGAGGLDEQRYVAVSEGAVEREQQAILEYLRKHPEEKTFHAMRLEDGREPWVAPVLYAGGLHNPPSPPCHDPRTGEVFVLVRSAYTVWDGGSEVRPLTGVGKLNLVTGRVELVEHGHASRDAGRPAGRKDMPWEGFNLIGDETQTLSCSPEWLFSNHQGYLGGMNRASGLTMNFLGKRDTYGGFYGPGSFGWESESGREKAAAAGVPYGIRNEWHGPARAGAAVAEGRVYFNIGSQVICAKGGGQ
jgi:hypothetical protein